MSDRPKRLSSAVPAVLVLSIAAAMVGGCSRSREVRRCVDEQGNVLPESTCNRTGRVMYLGRMISPRWVYGGRVAGNRVSNFRTAPTAGADVVSPSGKTISRGGFGSSGSGRSFFGG